LEKFKSLEIRDSLNELDSPLKQLKSKKLSLQETSLQSMPLNSKLSLQENNLKPPIAEDAQNNEDANNLSTSVNFLA
jgi:hypothetical protein